MRRRIKHKGRCAIFLAFFMALSLALLMKPISAEASWIDRDSSGIYYEDNGGGLGQGLGQLDEDENAEEAEVDEGSGFFLELINTILCWLLSTIGRTLFELLDLVGASLDQLIYGRLVTENTLFTFDLGKDNIYGIVSFAIYGIISTCVVALLIPVFMGKVVLSTWKKGDFAKSSLKDAFSFFALSLMLIIFMPYFLDVLLFIRDSILYVIGTDGATSLFGSASTNSIISVLGEAANENIISGIVFVAAVVLNLYFLIGYVGIALSMTANFILFPMVVVKTAFDKRVLKDWVWEMVSCMFVPIIDAVLIMIPSFLGVYASELSALDSIGVSIVQLIICYLIIPIRSYSRGILGLRTNPLENSGLAAASFMGMAAARGIKNAFSESRDAKKNAELDRERANAEEDLAQLEKEEMEGGYAKKVESAEGTMPSSDDIRKMIDKKQGIDDFNDKEKEIDTPLGLEQSYADGLAAHIDSAEEDDDTPLPREAYLSASELADNKKRLEEIEGELQETENNKNTYEAQKNAVLDSASMNADEKARDIERLDKAIADENEKIESLQNEREMLLSVDDKIRMAEQRKTSLEEAYHKKANEAGIDASAKEEQLESINDEIKGIDKEISGLQKQKQKMLIESEKEALKKEPSTLRAERENLKAENETLNLERESLIRQREKLEAKQGNYVVGSKEHETIGQELKGLDQKIGKLDQEIGNNVAKQHTISSALEKQESGLYDRQAYNLHERVKAKEAYEASQSRVKELESALKEADEKKTPYLAEGTMQRRKMESELQTARTDMEKAKNRLGELSREDRKISERLHEISPDFNRYTEKDLRAAKQEQNVKRAALQKEIASVREQLENDPSNRQYYRGQIAKLQSEVADCNYASARIDQLLSSYGSAKGPRARGSVSNTAVGSDIGSEYEKRRAALMERYANVDNFERPEFAGISREKKAELYRERAMRTKQILHQKRLFGATGAVVGGSMGLWLGSTGVASGGIIGAAVGSELGMNHAIKKMDALSAKPMDYTGKPLDFKVSADLRDNTKDGAERTVQRVKAELAESLQSDRFRRVMTEELVKNNLIKGEIKTLFKKHKVTKDNYAAKRGKILAELETATCQTMENAEIRIIEKCAGGEYAKLSENVKKNIVRSVAKPNMDVLKDLCENQYLCSKWQPHYEEYFDD